MLETLGFYNHYGNGDIFESREFVRTLMKLFPAKKYTYATGKSPRILMDIPELEVEDKFTVEQYTTLDPRIAVTRGANSLYFNTWIGRDSRYVLPGIGCTIEKLYEMYNDMLRPLGKRLPGYPLDYLTDFNYELYETKGINEHIKHRNRYRVFVSNGRVNSSQAVNFDLSKAINRLAEEWKGIDFYVTEPFETENENIIDANTLIPEGLDSNLVELSYLAQYCVLLVGRNSGPQVFSWTKSNCNNMHIINLTFSNHTDCYHFVHHSPIKMLRLWSGAKKPRHAYEHLDRLLKEIFK